MADILPIKGWRYSETLAENIEELTSPLFDVVSQKQREALYQNEYNSIHLSVPRGDDAHIEAAKRLKDWKSEGVIAQDPLPGIYVYYQYFTLPGSSKEYCRKGFICNIKAYDWDEGQILRHENTIPQAVNDRIDLLRETALNVSPTHGLYTDPEHILERYMDEAIQVPIYESEDYQGVRDVMSVIHDAKVIGEFISMLDTRKVILADGHHRYEGSLTYRKEMMATNPGHDGTEGYNFHMMYLTNTESDDLRILPTHRVIDGIEGLDDKTVLERAGKWFIIKHIENPYDVNEVILGKKWAFGLLLKDDTYKIRLKPEVMEEMDWNFPDAVKNLDLTVLHYFFLEKVLDIPGSEQRRSPNISFNRSFPECLHKVLNGEAQMALITKDISMEEVKAVCHSGFTMPQKSTYFYPKVICGFVFSSIMENEFFADKNYFLN